MKTLTRLVRVGLCSLLLVAGYVSAEQYNAPEAEGQGEIQGLNFASNQMLVNGMSYDVSPDVRVQIGGSYGAFTMLEEGMQIEFKFLHFSDGVRRITFMQEVPQVEGY